LMAAVDGGTGPFGGAHGKWLAMVDSEPAA
jgi:hypothetical protein